MADSEDFLNKKTFNHDRENGLRPGVVVCVINKKLKVLLCFKREHEIWGFPQGGIREGESLEDALSREVKEELGEQFLKSLFIPEKPLVAVDQIVFPRENLQGKVFVINGKEVPMVGKKYYFCAVAQVAGVKPAAGEYSDFRWVAFEEGMKIIDEINQKGKKRILKKALEILKDGGLIT